MHNRKWCIVDTALIISIRNLYIRKPSLRFISRRAIIGGEEERRRQEEEEEEEDKGREEEEEEEWDWC